MEKLVWGERARKQSQSDEWKQYVINNYNHRWSHLNVCAVYALLCACVVIVFFSAVISFLFYLNSLTLSRDTNQSWINEKILFRYM